MANEGGMMDSYSDLSWSLSPGFSAALSRTVGAGRWTHLTGFFLKTVLPGALLRAKCCSAKQPAQREVKM
jgi:hypothetical protein